MLEFDTFENISKCNLKDKIRAILIDDEISALNALKIIVEEFSPMIQIVGVAQTSIEGLQLLKTVPCDVVFIDIQMPHMSGIELLQSLQPNINFEIVFLTAFNNHASEAFRLKTLDYLLKPIHLPDYFRVVEKLQEKLETSGVQRSQFLQQAFENKIAMSGTDGVEFINVSDIIRIEASGSYVTIYGNKILPKVYSKNLKTMESLLQKHPFFRAHKSHLINLTHIQKYVSFKDGGTITMIDGSMIDLSRAHKEEFAKLYK